MKKGINRRGFLRGALGSLATLITTRARWLFPEIPVMLGSAVVAGLPHAAGEGELYEGFILLDRDAPLPESVQLAPIPILCHLQGDDASNPQMQTGVGVTSTFDTVEALRKDVPFPLITALSLPNDRAMVGATLIRFAEHGDIWEARINYGPVDSREPLISSIAHPTFPRPYPVWPDIAYPEKKPGELILNDEYFIRKAERVDFTPRPGILVTMSPGYMLQWIKNGVLYTVAMADSNGPVVEELLGQLLEQ